MIREAIQITTQIQLSHTILKSILRYRFNHDEQNQDTKSDYQLNKKYYKFCYCN